MATLLMPDSLETRRLRNLKGLSQVIAAEEIGISTATLRRMESRPPQRVRGENIILAARYYEVPPEQITLSNSDAASDSCSCDRHKNTIRCQRKVESFCPHHETVNILFCLLLALGTKA